MWSETRYHHDVRPGFAMPECVVSVERNSAFEDGGEALDVAFGLE